MQKTERAIILFQYFYYDFMKKGRVYNSFTNNSIKIQKR